MTFLQIVTMINVYLVLLFVSDGVGHTLYFGLIIGDQDDGGARMGVKDSLNRITEMNLLPRGYMLDCIELQVKNLDPCFLISVSNIQDYHPFRSNATEQ